MKAGILFRIEKLTRGQEYGTVPGSYLNSPPRWLPAGSIIARSVEVALASARYQLGTADVRIYEALEGEL